MVMTLRKRAPIVMKERDSSPERERSPSPQRTKTIKRRRRNFIQSSDDDSDEYDSSDKENGPNVYESEREKRIRENRERMEKLGIFTLSSQMNTQKKKTLPLKKKDNPLVPRLPRAFRKRNEPRGNRLETEGITIQPGIWKPEVYTEEDEKLLGSCETEWTLNVDGFSEDGDRLFDPVSGTSCHHCRQKTSRKHTCCVKCRSGQGQLCGDCLYTRYGENVVEVLQNPTWQCPACRGICNCSRCRREKGWPPVTALYEKVVKLGYKSVAHYLIKTRHVEKKVNLSEDGAVAVDLTEADPAEPPALMEYDSDTSGNWSESGSEDSDEEDSKVKKQSQVDVSEVTNGFAGDADQNEHQEMIVIGS